MSTINKEIKNPYGFVYITTNLINGKKYLGQRKFYDKWQEYLGSGVGITRAINKYGQENFSRNIIFIAYSIEELNAAEYELSVFLDVVNDDNWYNVVYGGGATSGWNMPEEVKNKISKTKTGKYCGKNHPNYGKTMSEEQRLKISQTRLGKYCGKNNPNYGNHLSEESKQKIRESRIGKCCGRNSPRAKTILQYTKEGIFLREWETITKAGRELNISYSDIVKCCRSGLKTAGGFIWCYTDDTNFNISEACKNIGWDVCNEKNNNYGKGKHVIQYTLDGVEVKQYVSIYEASHKTGISEYQIKRCCDGKINDIEGFKWRYNNDIEQNE